MTSAAIGNNKFISLLSDAGTAGETLTDVINQLDTQNIGNRVLFFDGGATVAAYYVSNADTVANANSTATSIATLTAASPTWPPARSTPTTSARFSVGPREPPPRTRARGA